MKTKRRQLAAAVALAAFLTFASVCRGQIRDVVVTSGATFESGLPPKGSIGTLFCRGLTGIQGIVAAQAVPLPRELAGVRVRVGGALAPLFAVANAGDWQQVNFQVPQEASFTDVEPIGFRPTGGRSEVGVEQGGMSAKVSVDVSASPGEFFRNADGTAIVVHASDFSLVTSAKPARRGEMLSAFLTGMPETQPIVASGEAAPAEQLAVVPQFELSGQVLDKLGVAIYLRDPDPAFGVFRLPEVVPTFMGLAPGLVGVYQVNFRFPDQLFPPGMPPDDSAQIAISRSVRIQFGAGESVGSRTRIPIECSECSK